jgi:parvulin-like peptidyl-prolyl isomerase
MLVAKDLFRASLISLLWVIAVVSSPALAVQAKDSDLVIVARGTAKVTFGDVDAYVQRIPEKDRAGFMDSPKRIENLLQALLLQRQLAQASADEVVKQKIPFNSVERLAAEETLSKQTLDSHKSSIQVPDLLPLARETYLLHKSDYVEHGRVDIQQVLIGTDKHTDDEARKLALNVEAQAKAAPESFAELVKSTSEDPTKSDNGGMVVGPANDKYATELAEAVGDLKHDGDISPIVKTSFGYHVLKLVKRGSDRQKSFDEVSSALLADITLKYLDQQMRGYIGSFENMPLDANPELVGALRDRYMPVSSATSIAPVVPTLPAAKQSAH